MKTRSVSASIWLAEIFFVSAHAEAAQSPDPICSSVNYAYRDRAAQLAEHITRIAAQRFLKVPSRDLNAYLAYLSSGQDQAALRVAHHRDRHRRAKAAIKPSRYTDTLTFTLREKRPRTSQAIEPGD